MEVAGVVVPADQLLWACSFGAMLGLSALVFALSFFPLRDATAAERATPPELVAYLAFGCAFVLYTLAVVDPFPLTQWMPLIAAIIVCAVLASFGSRLARNEPLLPDAVLQASTPARVATTVGILLVGAFYARISSSQSAPDSTYISWVPLLIVGHLIAMAGRFVGRLMQDPSKRFALTKQQALVVVGALAVYVWLYFGSLSGEHLLDWRHYGIAVFVLALGATSGAMFGNSTGGSGARTVPPPPAVRNPHRSAVVTSSAQRQHGLTTASTSSVGKVAGDVKNRHYGEAAAPTRLLDHFDLSESSVKSELSSGMRADEADMTAEAKRTTPSLPKSTEMSSSGDSSSGTSPKPTPQAAPPQAPSTHSPVEESAETTAAKPTSPPTLTATAAVEAEVEAEKGHAGDAEKEPEAETTFGESTAVAEPARVEKSGETEAASAAVEGETPGGEKPSDADEHKEEVPAVEEPEADAVEESSSSRPTSATESEGGADRPTSASSSKGKSRSKRRGHKSNSQSGEHH